MEMKKEIESKINAQILKIWECINKLIDGSIYPESDTMQEFHNSVREFKYIVFSYLDERVDHDLTSNISILHKNGIPFEKIKINGRGFCVTEEGNLIRDEKDESGCYYPDIDYTDHLEEQLF